MNKYLYRMGHWAETDPWGTFESDGGYHEAAERIVERYEWGVLDFSSDEHTVTLRDEKHDTPRTFTVDVESTRTYSAAEEK